MATLDEIGQEKQRISERLARLDGERTRAIPSISAAFARTTMTYHSPPVMVAIGLLGDEAGRVFAIVAADKRALITKCKK
jgi:hypothetical protein